MTTKVSWPDASTLRKPTRRWRVKQCIPYLEALICVPAGTIVFKRADGTDAQPTDTLGELRGDGWNATKPERTTTK